MQRKTVTVHDVARVAGVSIITVSRALREPGKLAEATLAKVREAVAQTGYVPNHAAGTLRAASSGFVAALVPTVKASNFAGLVEGLTAALAPQGWRVLIGEIGYAGASEEELLRAVIGRRPDAIVITGVVHTAESRRLLVQSGIPVVETWDLTAQPVDMVVGASHDAIGEAACAYLAGRGRRRLAHIGADDERARRRACRFVETAARLGLEAPLVHTVRAPSGHADGRHALGEVLARRPEVDAICCGSDMLAMGVLTEARVRGIDVPRRLAVLGGGDADFAATLSPSLSSIRIDGPRSGRLAAGLIVARLRGEAVDPRVIDVGFEIIARESG